MLSSNNSSISSSPNCGNTSLKFQHITSDLSILVSYLSLRIVTSACNESTRQSSKSNQLILTSLHIFSNSCRVRYLFIQNLLYSNSVFNFNQMLIICYQYFFCVTISLTTSTISKFIKCIYI